MLRQLSKESLCVAHISIEEEMFLKVASRLRALNDTGSPPPLDSFAIMIPRLIDSYVITRATHARGYYASSSFSLRGLGDPFLFIFFSPSSRPSFVSSLEVDAQIYISGVPVSSHAISE